MQQVKCGVIGLGIGEAHAVNCMNNPDAQLWKICDLDYEKAQALARKYHCRAVAHADEILDDPEIDLVVIASYDSCHFEQAGKAIINGKAVYIEKPAVCTVDQAKQLRLLVNRHSCSISSNLVLRTCPLFQGLRDKIRGGGFKDIYYIQAAYLWGRVHKILDGWRKEDPGYSIIAGAAVHLVDLICWLTGGLPDCVSAHGNRLATEEKTTFEDFAALRLSFPDGLIAEVAVHGGCAHPHFHELRIYGSEKTFYHDLGGSRWIDLNGGVAGETSEYPAKNRRHLAIDSFIGHLAGNIEAALVSADDMFNSLSICLAAEQSLRQNNETISIRYY